MAVTAAFSDFVAELLEGMGPLRFKRMFGAAGVYADDVIFAVIDDDILYLKTDEPLREELKAAGSGPAVITDSKGAKVELGYWRIPESALDEPEEAVAWARKALAVAVAKRKPKKGSKR